mmetsp:Transcript_15048/g.30478  ORF Transcript_15048/g.30478 Transcript_15048/m.30478 type:complete len:137 (-) Transcript_15048:177-587(-)
MNASSRLQRYKLDRETDRQTDARKQNFSLSPSPSSLLTSERYNRTTGGTWRTRLPSPLTTQTDRQTDRDRQDKMKRVRKGRRGVKVAKKRREKGRKSRRQPKESRNEKKKAVTLRTNANQDDPRTPYPANPSTCPY